MTQILDTHTHLCDRVFDADRMEVLSRALEKGVGAVIGVSETLKDAEKNLELADRMRFFYAAAGLYPTFLNVTQAEEMAGFILTNTPKLAAIGEVGLDYWAVQEEKEREVQRHIFKMFIALSKSTGLPLNVHSRSAGRHAVDMLLHEEAKKVQLHAFDGKFSAALPAVEAGYFFSVPPSIVRSRQKQKLVKNLPLSSLLVETDSPVLGPEPGSRNEPGNITVAIEAIAEIKKISVQEVLGTVWENSIRLYGDTISLRVEKENP